MTTLSDERSLRMTDEVSFGDFLRSARLGDTWAPMIHDAWDRYLRIVGRDEEKFQTNVVSPGNVKYCYPTKFQNLYYEEVVQIWPPKSVVLSRVLRFYKMG